MDNASTASARQDRLTVPLPDAFGIDPSPTLRRLREEEPVALARTVNGHEVWLVTRYADVKTVLSDPRFSRAEVVRPGRPYAAATPPRTNTLPAMDPPEHTRLRGLVTASFAHRRIEQRRQWVREQADRCVDELVAAGAPADLQLHLATRLPLRVICELLGAPVADEPAIREWTEAMYSLEPDTARAANDAYDALLTYMAALVDEKERVLAAPAAEPADLLGELLRTAKDSDRISHDELVHFGVTMLVGGYETTANQIGAFVIDLLRRPARWESLRADPALLPDAIEELLRSNMLSETGQVRVALEDVELSGTLIRAGEGVMAHIGAANRDADVFTAPDEIDFRRSESTHLTFGHGIHYCLGAHLARVELQEALGVLLSRLPGLRLAVPAEDIVWRRSLLRGPQAVLVAWEE
ncbi:cytochrome P450 [Streptomyces sp. NPDC017979]|uniref:cytochrome P450 n=1 Tax=Streptomyces sp. NPDC017979 TaxID=3365024 RepID=UPI0037B15705